MLIRAAKKLFRDAGWKTESGEAPGGHEIDFVAVSPSGREMVVEVKDRRPDEEAVDFWTVLGQVVVDMDGSNRDYAVLVPGAGLRWFRRHLTAYARERLGLRVLVVDAGKLLEADLNYNLRALRE